MTKKKIIFILAAISAIIAGALAVYFLVIKKGSAAPQSITPQAQTEEQAPKIFIKPADKKYDLDRDGIDDEEEKKLGTSNKDSDTDGDGLTDNMEISKFKTDPTKADTDGDGFGDGVELISGYNPLGTGKL